MEYIRQSQTVVESTLNTTLENPYIMAIVKITLILYAVMIAPKPPGYLEELFKNTYFKIFAIALIIYLSEKDLQLAILISVVYVFGMNLVSGRGILESFSPFSAEYKNENGSKLIEPKTAIYPGCQNITMDDLIKIFGGDQEKMISTAQNSFRELLKMAKTKDGKESLTKTAYAAGLPYNMSFDKPETAPYIATLLVNYGFQLSDSCAPPM